MLAEHNEWAAHFGALHEAYFEEWAAAIAKAIDKEILEQIYNQAERKEFVEWISI